MSLRTKVTVYCSPENTKEYSNSDEAFLGWLNDIFDLTEELKTELRATMTTEAERVWYPDQRKLVVYHNFENMDKSDELSELFILNYNYTDQWILSQEETGPLDGRAIVK